MDKRTRSTLFRARLGEAMQSEGLNQSVLARRVGVDRSTISQLLAEGEVRLPNAQVVGECASALGVSADWLLGLSQRPERAGDLLSASFSMPETGRTLADEQIFAWHREAEGYKIRHVPATLPDMLKTDAVLRWEYADQIGRTPDQAIGASEERLAWMRGGVSDYEIAFPLYRIEAFARAEGYYRGLSLGIRLEQIDRMLALHDQLYPGLRLFIYDAPRVFSAPLTIFGPLLAALYLGRHYIVFRDTERVRVFTRHFDWLVREAKIPARDLPKVLTRLRREIATE